MHICIYIQAYIHTYIHTYLLWHLRAALKRLLYRSSRFCVGTTVVLGRFARKDARLEAYTMALRFKAIRLWALML